MKLTRAWLLFAVVAIPAVAAADPVRIVDTGPGPSAPIPGFTLDQSQWLAAEFTVPSPVTITGVEGWIGALDAGEFNVVLYSDGGGVPGTRLVQRAAFAAPGSTDWRGILDANIAVAPGNYWAAFEVLQASRFFGTMPAPSERPVLHEAFAHSESGHQYFATDALDIGVRVTADVAPTPEPASLLLFMTGIAGFAIKRAAAASRPLQMDTSQ